MNRYTHPQEVRVMEAADALAGMYKGRNWSEVDWKHLPQTLAAKGFFEIMGRIKSVSKVVQKTGFFLQQNMDKTRTKNTTFFRQ